MRIAASVLLLGAVATMAAAQEPGRFWFNRSCAHWGRVDEDMVDYLLDVRPQVAICGYFGPNLWAAGSYAREKGEPASWTSLGGGPVDRDWWRNIIDKAHQNDVKMLGMFCLNYTYGDHEKPAGFFKFYDREWDEDVLGPRPEADALSMMQKNADGTPLTERIYKVEGGTEYYICPNNPAWRATAKAMVTAALEQGLDGFHAVWAKRFDCTCRPCREGFRKWLAARYNAAQLREQFGIEDLVTHHFTSINGSYDPDQASPYALECLKFSQSSTKDFFDEVLIEHGRGIKPDLILGQWNHFYRNSSFGPGQQAGTFAQLNADELCVLPSERWGWGEDYIWYSIGNYRFGDYDKPEMRTWGEFNLERKYFYEAGGGRPSVAKTDDPVRVALVIAESVANGGFAYPRGPNYKDPETREIVRSYFDFLRRHEDLYRPVTSYAEAALVWRRTAVHRGDTMHTDAFKKVGMLLVKNHVLFDVMLDENITPERLSKYRLVLVPDGSDLPLGQVLALEGFIDAGGTVVDCSPEAVGSDRSRIEGELHLPPAELSLLDGVTYFKFATYLDRWLPTRSTAHSNDTFALNCFLREGSDDRPARLVAHLVNYNRMRKPLEGSSQQRPIPQQNISVTLRLPAGSQVGSVKVLTPEDPEPKAVLFRQEPALVHFSVPTMMAYAVGVVELK